MRKTLGRGALGLGLISVVMALTLVIAGAAVGYEGNATSVDEGVADNPRCPAGLC